MTRARAPPVPCLLALATIAACGDPQLNGGPGTHPQGSFCLPDAPEPDSTTHEATTGDPTSTGTGGWTSWDPTTGSSVSEGPTNSSNSSDDFVAAEDTTLAVIAGEGFGEPPALQLFANPFAD